MRISGTESSSVILTNTQKTLPNEVEVKRDGVINQQNYHFKSILKSENFQLHYAMGDIFN